MTLSKSWVSWKVVHWAATIVLALVAFFGVKGCYNEKHKTPQVIVHDTVDESKQNVKIDSLTKAAIQHDSAKQEFKKKLDVSNGMVNDYKEKVFSLAQQVRAARVMNDTAKYYQSCDSLADENLMLLAVLETQNAYIDTVMTIMAYEIIVRDSIIAQKDEALSKFRTEYAKQVNRNINLQMQVAKSKGKKWNLSLSGGYGIGRDFKPTPIFAATVGRTIARF